MQCTQSIKFMKLMIWLIPISLYKYSLQLWDKIKIFTFGQLTQTVGYFKVKYEHTYFTKVQ